MIAHFGKFLLVLSLCLQGSLLIQGLDAKKNFDSNLVAFANSVPQLNVLNAHTEHFDCIRFGVAGLYFASVLLLVSSCCCFPLLTALGVLANTALLTFPTLLKNPQDMNATIVVLKNLSILGGLIYLMGCNACKKTTATKSKTD